MEEEVVFPDELIDELNNFQDDAQTFIETSCLLSEEDKSKQFIQKPLPTKPILQPKEKTRYSKIANNLFLGNVKQLKELKEYNKLRQKLNTFEDKIVLPIKKLKDEIIDKTKTPEGIWSIIKGAAVGIFLGFFIFSSKFRSFTFSAVVSAASAIKTGIEMLPKIFEIAQQKISAAIEIAKDPLSEENRQKIEQMGIKLREEIKDTLAKAIESIFADSSLMEWVYFLADVIEGASIGATVGSIFPGLGTLAGAGIGAVIGGLWYFIDKHLFRNNNKEDNAKNTSKDLQKKIDRINRQIEALKNGNEGAQRRVENLLRERSKLEKQKEFFDKHLSAVGKPDYENIISQLQDEGIKTYTDKDTGKTVVGMVGNTNMSAEALRRTLPDMQMKVENKIKTTSAHITELQELPPNQILEELKRRLESGNADSDKVIEQFGKALKGDEKDYVEKVRKFIYGKDGKSSGVIEFLNDAIEAQKDQITNTKTEQEIKETQEKIEKFSEERKEKQEELKKAKELVIKNNIDISVSTVLMKFLNKAIPSDIVENIISRIKDAVNIFYKSLSKISIKKYVFSPKSQVFNVINLISFNTEGLPSSLTIENLKDIVDISFPQKSLAQEENIPTGKEENTIQAQTSLTEPITISQKEESTRIVYQTQKDTTFQNSVITKDITVNFENNVAVQLEKKHMEILKEEEKSDLYVPVVLTIENPNHISSTLVNKSDEVIASFFSDIAHPQNSENFVPDVFA